jgi:hypothetical protein
MKYLKYFKWIFFLGINNYLGVESHKKQEMLQEIPLPIISIQKKTNEDLKEKTNEDLKEKTNKLVDGLNKTTKKFDINDKKIHNLINTTKLSKQTNFTQPKISHNNNTSQSKKDTIENTAKLKTEHEKAINIIKINDSCIKDIFNRINNEIIHYIKLSNNNYIDLELINNYINNYNFFIDNLINKLVNIDDANNFIEYLKHLKQHFCKLIINIEYPENFKKEEEKQEEEQKQEEEKEQKKQKDIIKKQEKKRHTIESILLINNIFEI